MEQQERREQRSRLHHSVAGDGSSRPVQPRTGAAPVEGGLLDLLAEKEVLPANLLAEARENPPLRLGTYQIRGWLGEGGMGTVLRAFDPQLGREVALKLLADTRDAAVGRFQREAQALARLNHPSVVEIYGLHLEGEVPFFAMELVAGESLDRILAQRGAQAEPEVWTLLEQVTHALAHAEGHGVLHRDLKPSNLMVETGGGEPRYRICDFGLAQVSELASSLTQDTRSRLVGSLPYMSPEQLRLQPLDARSDMYSLGVTLYELLTGDLPQRNLESSEEEPDFLDVQAQAPHVSSGLSHIVSLLTRRRRDERPFSWTDVREAVRLARAGAVTASGDSLDTAIEAATEVVPAGLYVIGHEGVDATIYERPRVQVEVSAFSIDRALFTNRDLLTLLAACPKAPELERWRHNVAQERLQAELNAPLTKVTWEEAAHLARLARGRLPSLVEWEVFALHALQVGRAEEFQLFHWQEWTADWIEFGFHKRLLVGQPVRDPLPTPATKERRAVTGRGHRSALPRRPSYHLGYPPPTRRADMGFRVVNRGREKGGDA